jgi:hypothetical protein
LLKDGAGAGLGDAPQHGVCEACGVWASERLGDFHALVDHRVGRDAIEEHELRGRPEQHARQAGFDRVTRLAGDVVDETGQREPSTHGCVVDCVGEGGVACVEAFGIGIAAGWGKAIRKAGRPCEAMAAKARPRALVRARARAAGSIQSARGPNPDGLDER